MLCAELFAVLADAHMGAAGYEEPGSRERSKSIGEASRCLERALGCRFAPLSTVHQHFTLGLS